MMDRGEDGVAKRREWSEKSESLKSQQTLLETRRALTRERLTAQGEVPGYYQSEVLRGRRK